MKNKILFAFLYLVAFTAVGQAIIYFEQMPTLDVIYSNCRLALFPIVLFVFFIKKVKWNGFFTLLALYFSVILFSSIEHGTNALIPLISLTITTISLIASISIGAKVDFDGTTKTVTAEKDGIEIKLTIGNDIAFVNGAENKLLVPAEIKNSRTMVPLRFVSEALGAKVDWDGSTKTITIVNEKAGEDKKLPDNDLNADGISEKTEKTEEKDSGIL